MSQELRDSIVNDTAHFVFASQSQKDDINKVIGYAADGTALYKTKSTLIEMIDNIRKAGFITGFTAICSDHHNDSYLGEHCHFNGYCFDGYPMNSNTPGDWMKETDPRFAEYCHIIAVDPDEWQEGLAGAALTHDAIVAAGKNFFTDDGGDHIHAGANG